MKKKNVFIITLIALLLGGYIGFSFPVMAADDPIQLKFAHWVPPVHPIVTQVLEPWCRDLEKSTNGRVKVTIYGGGALGSAQDHYDLAYKGTADIAFISPGFTPGAFPLTDAMNLPMLFPSSEVAGLVFWDLFEKYLKGKEYTDVVVLYGVPTSTFQLTTRKKPVHMLEDLRGLKIASTAIVVNEIIKQLGGVPVYMSSPEVYTSLERGLTDGVFYGWDTIAKFGHYEVTKFRTENIDLGMNFAMMIMNKDTYQKLPADIQQVINERTGAELSKKCGALFDMASAKLREDVVAYDKKVGNPPIYRLPDAERERWRQAVLPLYDEWAGDMEKKGLPGKAVVKDMRAWTEKYSQ